MIKEFLDGENLSWCRDNDWWREFWKAEYDLDPKLASKSFSEWSKEKKMPGSGEWYQLNKFLRKEDIPKTRITVIKRRDFGENGSEERPKVQFLALDETGSVIGRLDPNRGWSRNLILRAEENVVDEKGPEDNERVPAPGESGERSPWRTT